MVQQRQVVEVCLSKAELDFIHQKAKTCGIGGDGRVRNPKDRAENYEVDQLVGQIGSYVGCRHLFGDVTLYRISRSIASRYPTSSDGGSDIPGANVDFKATHWKTVKPMLDHHLLVRAGEYHLNTVYVGILVKFEDVTAKAFIVGWQESSMLTKYDVTPKELPAGFVGYAAKFSELNPMMPLRWWS